MARTTRTHVGPDSIASENPSLTPKHLTKQEFGRRVWDMMNGKGWSQSDLARAAGLPRDSISTYVNGKSFPQGKSLLKLAAAFGVPPQELLPNDAEAAIDRDFPAFEMKISPNAPQMAWVRINRAVPTPIALKIAGLIGEADNDDPAKGK